MASNHSTEVALTSYDQQQTPITRDVELHDADNDQAFYLPPTDGGKDAWLCLMACFMLEAMIWGKSTSCVPNTIADGTQAFLLHTASSKSTMPLMTLLGRVTSLLLVPAPWASCTWVSQAGTQS